MWNGNASEFKIYVGNPQMSLLVQEHAQELGYVPVGGREVGDMVDSLYLYYGNNGRTTHSGFIGLTKDNKDKFKSELDYFINESDLPEISLTDFFRMKKGDKYVRKYVITYFNGLMCYVEQRTSIASCEFFCKQLNYIKWANIVDMDTRMEVAYWDGEVFTRREINVG